MASIITWSMFVHIFWHHVAPLNLYVLTSICILQSKYWILSTNYISFLGTKLPSSVRMLTHCNNGVAHRLLTCVYVCSGGSICVVLTFKLGSFSSFTDWNVWGTSREIVLRWMVHSHINVKSTLDQGNRLVSSGIRPSHESMLAMAFHTILCN